MCDNCQIRGRGNQSTELRAVLIFRKVKIRGWRRHTRIKGRPDFTTAKLISLLHVAEKRRGSDHDADSRNS